jgi:hypothetical protein
LGAQQKNWALAAAWIAWITATLAPALTFDVGFAMGSDMGPKLQAFFQILCTAMFLIAWKRIRRFPMALLLGLAFSAFALFLTYSLLREQWTCQYLEVGRFVKGGDMLPAAYQFLESRGFLRGDCAFQMSQFPEANGTHLWEFRDLVARFLTIFAAYAFAWLTSALLIVGALNEWKSRSEA